MSQGAAAAAAAREPENATTTALRISSSSSNDDTLLMQRTLYCGSGSSSIVVVAQQQSAAAAAVEFADDDDDDDGAPPSSSTSALMRRTTTKSTNSSKILTNIISSSGGIRTVAELEEALEMSLLCLLHTRDGNENADWENCSNRPAVVYYPVPDSAWLGCRSSSSSRRLRRRPPRLGGDNSTRKQKNKTDDDDSSGIQMMVGSSSITGLLEDFSSSSSREVDDEACPAVVTLSLWKVADAAAAAAATIFPSSSNNSSNKPNEDWTRRPLTYTPPSLLQRRGRDATFTEANPNTLPLPPIHYVQWVDLRRLNGNADAATIFPTTAAVVYFLRSLLLGTPTCSAHAAATSNTSPPWCAVVDENMNEKDKDETTDCVMLLFRKGAPAPLVSFRVSDACPSWCLYSSALLLLDDDDEDANMPDDECPANACARNGSHVTAAARKTCELLVYRRLPPRERLSSLHPVTQEPVPVDGCLWETVVTLPLVVDAAAAEGHDFDDDDDSNDSDDGDDDAEREDEPTVSYRLTAPPYINCAVEYKHLQLQKLLEPAAQRILREEAAKIPQWTAWPEQQHYRANTAVAAATEEADAAAPWNVFPLLHCFPAHDVSRRQWIEPTAAHVPHTVQLLKRIVGDALRTALFSRLDADSVLEAHTGWADLANHVYRVHVPIYIPDDDGPDLCGTWVDGCVVTHAPDRLIAFDDSKTHRAFNYSQHSRVVLILDLARPPHLPLGTATGGHSEELDSFIAQFAAPN